MLSKDGDLMEKKNCQNCDKEFEIRPKDTEFYEKISVPEPTFCPDCRQQRRLAFRNERVFYARKCAVPGHEETLITLFHPTTPFKVVDSDYWWGDKWDPFEYGRDYDFSKPFFEQMIELQKDVPRPHAAILWSENCEFANLVAGCKNCYIIVSAEKCEDCFFGARMFYCNNCCDCEDIYDSQLCYECFNAKSCYGCSWSEKIENCRDVHFSFDLRNCNDCVGCTSLRDKNFCWFNEQLTEEEYNKRLAEARINTLEGAEKVRKQADEAKLKAPRRFAQILKSENSTGDNILNSQNVDESFTINKSKDVSYSLCCTEAINVKDASYSDFCENVYENMSSEHDNGKKFCYLCWECRDVEYCDSCHSGCSDLFGCVGIQHGQYSILNKKYSKEEYEELKAKIIRHMDEMPYTTKNGKIYKYGEYFPPEFSAYAYNETVALEYYPTDKETAQKRGFVWRDAEVRNYQTTLSPDKLPQTSEEVGEEMLKQTIPCAHSGKCDEPCTHAFKIVGRELEFYKKMNLPLPTLCPMCRHFRRVKMRNPLELYHRQCMCDESGHDHEGKCKNEFETTFAPDRMEKIYCEKCYLKSVG